MPLREKTWRASNGVEAEPVGYLMGDEVQAELKTIYRTGDGCSLDVERKHAWDKAGEKKKVMSCARASRNAILRQYLRSQSGHVDVRTKAERDQHSVRHLNVRAMAIERRPDLFARGRGCLRWEGEVAAASRRLGVLPARPA